MSDGKIVIIGAGVGGLAAGAVLARLGLDVTVLEAHVYAGGSAGTFYHQGYRFDAGATLAGGFYPGGPMDLLGQWAGVEQWPARPVETAMRVHLPEGPPVEVRTGEGRWEAREAAFGTAGDDFWRWQERTADALWDLALCLPPWPPQTTREARRLVQDGWQWLTSRPRRQLPRAGLGALADAFRPVSAHLNGASERLRMFVDAQLLISAQTTSEHANALYGASALDLPRRGVVHLEGGMGKIAALLVQAVRQHGGQVLFRQEVVRIRQERGTGYRVETRRGGSFSASTLIANLPPWNLRNLLEAPLPRRLARLAERPADGWGAFVVYAGLDGAAVPPGAVLHHQVVRGRPLGEGSSLFLSLSPEWDVGRTPAGKRALTLSTHTDLTGWWKLFETDREGYERRKAAYTERLLASAERAVPGLRQAVELVLPGTPVTFQRFTRRAWGWVGGFPQTSLLRAWGPRLQPGLWLVGDSIFPGQSTAAVALGGLRVAQAVWGEVAGCSQRTSAADLDKQLKQKERTT